MKLKNSYYLSNKMPFRFLTKTRRQNNILNVKPKGENAQFKYQFQFKIFHSQ